MDENENKEISFTGSCLKAIFESKEYAKNKNFEFVTVDNLMLFISKTPKGKEIFEAVGLNSLNFQHQIEAYLDEEIPKRSEDCSVGDKVFLCFKFPNVWMNRIAPNYKLVIFFAPVDEENTVLYIQVYSKLSRLKPLNALIASTSRLMSYIIERQDRRVVVTQKPKASGYFSEEKLLAGDRPIVLYRKMREELKRESSVQGDCVK